jgi:hypothetical protein
MTKPSKFQYSPRIPGYKHDAVEVNQSDTGNAPVLRPVVVLGDPNEGAVVIDRALFEAQVICLGKILEELQKMNEHLNQITEYES